MEPAAVGNISAARDVEAARAPQSYSYNRVVAIVRAFAEARLMHDHKRAALLFCSDGCHRLGGDRLKLPMLGTHVGRPAIYRSFEAIDIEYEVRDAIADELIIEGRRAVLRWRAIIRHRGTAIVANLSGLNYFRFRDGLIEEMAQFLDADWLPLVEDRIFEFRSER